LHLKKAALYLLVFMKKYSRGENAIVEAFGAFKILRRR
jgi:hypothetical protein